MRIEDLEPLVGEWRTTVAMPGVDAPVHGQTTFTYLAGGGYLVQQVAVDDPRFPTGIMVIGPDSGGDRIVQHYFDARGVARVYQIALDGGVLRLWRDGPDFAQRYTGVLSADGAVIDGAWERCDDGVSWQHDFDLTSTRVRSNTDVVRALFDAYRAQDRDNAERLLAPDLAFTSPQDDHIDKATYLARCFPTADRFAWQQILKLVDAGDDSVFILYEYELTTGDRHRNAEYLTVRDGQVVEIQVFFGGRV
jgi:ketosteroid isomerase-like protein